MRWLEFMKDYGFGLRYHPGKANVEEDVFEGEKNTQEGGLNCVY